MTGALAPVQEDLNLVFGTQVWQLQGDPTSLVSEDTCTHVYITTHRHTIKK